MVVGIVAVRGGGGGAGDGGRLRSCGSREVGGLGEVGVGDDHAGTGVVQHVFELGERMGDRQRHRDASACPDPELHGNVGASGGDEVGNAVTGLRRRQPVAPTHCLAQEFGVVPVPAFVHQGGSVGERWIGRPARQGDLGMRGLRVRVRGPGSPWTNSPRHSTGSWWRSVGGR